MTIDEVPVQLLLAGIDIAKVRLQPSIGVCKLEQPIGIVGENKIVDVSFLCIVIIGVNI